MSSTVDATDPEVIAGDETPGESDLAVDDVVARFREDVRSGMHWFEALLDAIGRWRAPGETRSGRRYDYLIAGEAFDWLLLA